MFDKKRRLETFPNGYVFDRVVRIPGRPRRLLGSSQAVGVGSWRCKCQIHKDCALLTSEVLSQLTQLDCLNVAATFRFEV